MNRDYFINPHQRTHDSRYFGKTGPVIGMVGPSIWERLFGRKGVCLDPVTRSSDKRGPKDVVIGEKVS